MTCWPRGRRTSRRTVIDNWNEGTHCTHSSSAIHATRHAHGGTRGTAGQRLPRSPPTLDQLLPVNLIVHKESLHFTVEKNWSVEWNVKCVCLCLCGWNIETKGDMTKLCASVSFRLQDACGCSHLEPCTQWLRTQWVYFLYIFLWIRRRWRTFGIWYLDILIYITIFMPLTYKAPVYLCIYLYVFGLLKHMCIRSCFSTSCINWCG